MKILSIVISCLFFSSFLRAENADEILKKAETIRIPTEDHRSTVLVVDIQGSKTDSREYEVLLKENKALINFKKPESDSGNKVLMVDADMWIYTPSAAKPIRISPRQKVTGNAAYGDIARLNFVGNYTATIAKKISKKNKIIYVLDLKSIDGRPVTYDVVEYWIDGSNYNPIRAFYKTISGKIIRQADFTQFKKVLGKKRPTKLVLTNFLKKDHITTLNFDNIKHEDFSDMMFEKQSLGKD